MSAAHTLPFSQIAIATIDLRRSDAFWREGIGFLPSAATRVFRGRTISNLMQVENARTTTRWVVGRDEYLQIEIWQFENPVSRLMDVDRKPNHVGFSRCGVQVDDFDGTVKRLSEMGYPPLTHPLGEPGNRRVCVRDPDGIHVELFENDILEDVVPPAAYACNAALRSITLTTDDFDATRRFVEQGLGLERADRDLHDDEHEALWGLSGAECQRATYLSGKVLLEVADYSAPSTVPRHPHERLIDQGILNIAFLDARSVRGIRQLEDQTLQHGASATERMVTPLGGCVYVTDPQGFNYELTWASRFLAQKIAGYFPIEKTRFPAADDRRVESEVVVEAPARDVWPFVSDPVAIGRWRRGVSALRGGQRDDYGVGALRKEASAFGEMVEEITHVQPEREVGYRVIRRGPFGNYCARFRLDEDGDRTRVTWTSRFRARVPGTGFLLQRIWSRRQRRALARLNEEVGRASG